MHRAALVIGVLFALAPPWMVPVGLILYGGGAGAIGGLFILACLIAVQWPAFALLQWAGLVPQADALGDVESGAGLTDRRTHQSGRRA